MLYIFAPSSYSWIYCMVSMAVFIANFLLVYKNDQKIGFNLIFAIAFWSVCFVFPVFVYPIDQEYSLFKFGYNADVITKATCLSQLAYSIFAAGFLLSKNNVKMNKVSQGSITLITEKNIQTLFFCSVTLFILVAIGGGYNYFSSQYNADTKEVSSSLFKYLFIILNLTVSLLCMSLSIVKSKSLLYKIVIYSLIVVLAYLMSGSRTYPLAVLLILLYFFFRNRLKVWQFILFLIVGVFLMNLVGSTRSSGVTAEGMVEAYSVNREWYDYLLDLIVTNRNLYDAYDYVQKNSITYGLTFMGNILAVIPFAQGIFCRLFGVPSYALTSATFITYNTLGKEMPLGLGTHIVGDVYMGSGIVGVFVLFFLLGYLVSYSSKKMETGDYRWMVVYLILLSDSVFMCRGAMFEMLRSLIWTQLFISIFGTRAYIARNIKDSLKK